VFVASHNDLPNYPHSEFLMKYLHTSCLCAHGMIAGTGHQWRTEVLDGKSLQINEYVPLGNFFAGDTTSRNGVRVSVKNLDGDNRADIITGSGSKVTGYLSNAIAIGSTPRHVTRNRTQFHRRRLRRVKSW